MKIDLHLHSEYSWDSNVTISEYIQMAEKNNFGAIAISDHNSTESHSVIEQLQEKTDVILIPGQEISTKDGHLLVYGWVDTLDKDMSMAETVEQAHRSGGYCIAAHPFDPFRGGSFSKIFDTAIDGLEILNASAWLGVFNSWAERGYNKQHNSIVAVANSDSHKIEEFGAAYTLISPASSLDEVITNLKTAQVGGSRIGVKRKLKRLILRKMH